MATEAQMEREVDAMVQRRLSTDSAYNNAEDSETQAAREQEISDEEYDRWVDKHDEKFLGVPCCCPSDCGCRHPWRTNYCGCKQH